MQVVPLDTPNTGRRISAPFPGTSRDFQDGNSSAMVKFLKWRALYKLGCCLSRLVSSVTSLRLARFPSATRNITLLPSAWGENPPGYVRQSEDRLSEPAGGL